jgi:dienelactone hydrolase
MDFGWYGDRDVTAAVSFLVAQPDVDDSRIGAVGLSMGGEQALGAAAADPRLRAVVAEGATHRVAGDKAYLERAYGARGRVQQAIDRVTTALTDLLTAAGPPITLRAAAGAAGPRPVLLIAAGAVAEEGLAARYIQDGNAHVQVWEAPGAGHTGGLAATPAEWQRRVTAFLDGALAVPGA